MKQGLDQVFVWMLSVFLSSSIFGGLYYLTAYLSSHDHQEDMASLDHQDTSHHGEEAESSHHDSSNHESSHNDSSHDPSHPSSHAQPHSKGHSSWSYAGQDGPEHWGSLSEDFQLCRDGLQQSPIDIPPPPRPTHSEHAGTSNGLSFSYHGDHIQLKNNGHTVQAVLSEKHSLKWAGQMYELKQFHFHAPSEHKVKGAPYDMEIHFVHQNAQGQLLVVGVLVEEKKENGAIKTLWHHLPRNENQSSEAFAFEPMSLMPHQKSFIHYQGSLTTPPCSEGVQWFVLNETISLSPHQMDEFRSVIRFNARPTQPLNGRKMESTPLAH